MILVVSATPQEAAFLGDHENVELLVTGIGPVEAAARVTQRLAQRNCDFVVNVGVAGAYLGALRIGDGVAVAEESIELDLEVGAPLALPAGLSAVDKARSDATLVSRLAGAGYRAARGITVTRVTATEATAARLRMRGVQVESMEGFAVLRAAEIARVRAIELRGISNYAGERSRSGWDFDAGIKGLADITKALLAAEGVLS